MSLYSVDNSTGDIDLLAGSIKYADNPIGTILPYGGTTAPSGWFLCQGQALSRTNYADLFAIIGTAFGSGDGSTTFNIPDLRGEFLRGAGTNSHSGQGNGGTVGQHQDASNILRMNTYGTDFYTFIDTRSDRGVYGNNFDSEPTNPGYIRASAAANILTSYTATPEVGGTVTTRPTNTSVNYIIKAKQVSVPLDIAEYIRNQNILSEYENITLPVSPIPYDGILTVSVSNGGYVSFSINSRNFTIGSASGTSDTSEIALKKGDNVGFIAADGTYGIYARYYKLRDYTGR